MDDCDWVAREDCGTCIARAFCRVPVDVPAFGFAHVGGDFVGCCSDFLEEQDICVEVLDGVLEPFAVGCSDAVDVPCGDAHGGRVAMAGYSLMLLTVSGWSGS